MICFNHLDAALPSIQSIPLLRLLRLPSTCFVTWCSAYVTTTHLENLMIMPRCMLTLQIQAGSSPNSRHNDLSLLFATGNISKWEYPPSTGHHNPIKSNPSWSWYGVDVRWWGQYCIVSDWWLSLRASIRKWKKKKAHQGDVIIRLLIAYIRETNGKKQRSGRHHINFHIMQSYERKKQSACIEADFPASSSIKVLFYTFLASPWCYVGQKSCHIIPS